MDRGRVQTYTQVMKKGKGRQRAEMMVSINGECAERVENKCARGGGAGGETEREDGEVGCEKNEGSVFILVQVSLFVEVFIFWWCKAFLRCRKGKKTFL